MKFADPTPAIKLSIQRMVCTGCGAEANASCNCGKAYVPKAVRAAEAVAANPEKSDRAIAADTGISQPTISKARHQLATDNNLSVDEPRIGLDGKTRKRPVRAVADPEQEEGRDRKECVALYQKVTEAERELAEASGAALPAHLGAMSGKPQPLRHATGGDLAYLERLIETLELRSEAWRREGKTVAAAEPMQTTRYLRQLCPPASRIHNRVWGNGDLFPAKAAP
jgi:hypothetical protein